jgi:hypothetical protein
MPAPPKKNGKSFPLPRSRGKDHFVGSIAAAKAAMQPPPRQATTAVLIHAIDVLEIHAMLLLLRIQREDVLVLV